MRASAVIGPVESATLDSRSPTLQEKIMVSIARHGRAKIEQNTAFRSVDEVSGEREDEVISP
jgi:hypothetical protein